MMGRGPQAPTVDPNISQQLIGIYNRNIDGVARRTGNADRAEDGRYARFGLDMLTNQGEVINADELQVLRKEAAKADARITKLNAAIAKGSRAKNMAKWQAELERLTTAKAERDTKMNTLASPDFAANKLRESFGEQYGMRDDLIGNMRGAVDSTSEYNRMQDALGRGVEARTTEAGALGDRLMTEAMNKVNQGGRLSAEAERDAIQSARGSMAARGLATSGAGMAAEFLNRDRYSRQREFENLGFARGVQTEDLMRRQANANMMAATDRFNVGLLEQSALRADQERLRQLGLGQDTYNFALGTDPRMVAAGLGQPYANLTGSTGAAANVLGSIAMNPQYSGGQFSSGGVGTAMGAGGALLGAGVGALLAAPTGGMSIPMGMALGGSLGGATGSFGGSFFR
jgi:hypothetical protein